MSSSFSQSEDGSPSDDSDFNFIPGYLPNIYDLEAEDTTDEDQPQQEHDACEPYADEPIADQEWIQQYEAEQAEKTQQFLERKSRLDGSKELNSWCTCGYCKIDVLQNPNECYCCCEIDQCVDALKSDLVIQDVQEPPVCITLHPAFSIFCLNKWSLRSSAGKYRRIDKGKYSQTGSEEIFLRSVSYRELVQLVYGHLGKTRHPLPACAYSIIRSTFLPNDENESFAGFEEDD